MANNINSVFLPLNIFETEEEAKYTKDYNFITDNFTNNPRTITLENALKVE